MNQPDARQLAELEAAVRVLRAAEARERGPSPHKPFAKQVEFSLLDEIEGLYGGAAGGGKTDALLAGGVRYAHEPDYAALLLRRTYPDLKLPGALMDRAHSWFDDTDSRWNEQDKRWTFPSGAVLQFGYCDTEADLQRYKSAEFQFIGIDELTEWPERWYTFLFSRLRRRKGSRIPLRMRAGTNPDGIGYRWIVKRFGIPEGVRIDGPIRAVPNRVFLPARAEDNPHLDLESYEMALEAMAGGRTSTRWRQLREGIWLPDNSVLVYAYSERVNAVSSVPDLDYYLVGIDYGFTDATAFTVLGWREHDPRVYVVESFKRTGLTPSDAAELAHALSAKYKPIRMVADIGGLGKGYAEEARRRFHLPIEPAEKNNKRGYIDLMNGDLRRARILVLASACAELVTEWMELPWHEDRSKEAPGFDNHCSDATLYAWRAACAFLEQPKAPPPTADERLREEERNLEDLSEQEAERIDRGEWWETM